MSPSRRKFIKTTGAGFIGLQLVPAFSGISSLADRYAPSFALTRTSPESQGISSSAIRGFIKAANESGVQWHSFMLVRHGKVVAEAWWKPFEPQFKHTLYSLSKSFTSTAIGMLVQEGKITVDDKVTAFFPDELPATVSDNLGKMTIKHLLTMNTGHGEDTIPKMRNATADTWTKTFLAQPVTYEPGSRFLYNTGATYMLGAILYKVTGDTLEEYLKRRLFKPLDIEDYDWETSPQGLNTAGFGLRIKTEDIARFGQTYLQKGKWDNKQVLPADWVEAATSYQTSSQQGDGDWSQGYGYQFWRSKPGFYRGDGAYGQFCIVMPQHDAVIAVTSESWNMQKSMTTLWDTLLPAMQADILAENPDELKALKTDIGNLSLPVVKGLPATPTAPKFNNKRMKAEKNDYEVDQLQFSFSADGVKWMIKKGKEEVTVQCGWSRWKTNNESKAYPFPIPGRIGIPSRIAGTATWINENTLQMNLRFVEAIHGDKITCVFNEGKVFISFLNSISENNRNTPENRKDLTAAL
jgi:CubicO group peptidase (beta-lactamase class C family)